MGLDVSTYVAFGIALDKSYVFTEEKTRGCSHKEADSKFCPECGKLMWIGEKIPLLESMEYKGLSYFYADYHSDEIILGFMMNKSGSHRMNQPSFLEVTQPTEKMLLEIKEFCDQNKIPYKPSDFKIYAFSNFSY